MTNTFPGGIIGGYLEKGFPLYIIEDANHSLETGDVMTDLDNLQKIMQTTEKYIRCGIIPASIGSEKQFR